MKFYFDKFRSLRIKNDISAKKICSRLKITKSTLWRWETGKIVPREDIIRKLAEVINVPISSISDLMDLSKTDISPISITYEHSDSKYIKILKDLIEIQETADRRNAILKAIMASNKIITYVKDVNLKYIAVNNEFLSNAGTLPNTSCHGKTDFSYFSSEEAKANSEEDKQVIYTGESVNNKECFMPGSRKKRVCLCNKYPIFDRKGKINGLAATFVDITERVNSENLLKVIHVLLEHIESPVVIHKISSNNLPEILYANKAYKELRGYTDGMSYMDVIDNALKIVLPEYKHIYEEIMSSGTLPKTGTVVGYNVGGARRYYRNHNFEAYPYRLGFFEKIYKT